MLIENLKGKYLLEDRGRNGNIILKWEEGCAVEKPG
jgi:hypothetical protein